VSKVQQVSCVWFLVGYRSHPNRTISQAPGLSGELHLLKFVREIVRMPLWIVNPRKTRNASHHSQNHIGPESALVRSEPIPNRAVRLMQGGERKHKYQPSPQE
jgi:hypothetical protein